jgi:hypothetical protein
MHPIFQTFAQEVSDDAMTMAKSQTAPTYISETKRIQLVLFGMQKQDIWSVFGGYKEDPHFSKDIFVL